MTVWQVALVVAGTGALGGIVAAVLSEDKGIVLPKRVSEGGSTIYRPGFVGLILVGALAAVVSWGLYGPLANDTLFGGKGTGEPARHDFGITVAAFVGAIGVGIGGSKWLASYVDKTILRQAAGTAADRAADSEIAREIRVAQPSRVLQLARTLK